MQELIAHVVNAVGPVLVATYLWVDRYQPDRAPDVAGLILVSTLASAVALPLVLAFVI